MTGRAARGGAAGYADAVRDNGSLRQFLHGLPGVDQVGAEARAAALGTRSIKKGAKVWALETAIRMVDLTTLEGADTHGKVRNLCAKARRPDPTDPACPSPPSASTRTWWPRRWTHCTGAASRWPASQPRSPPGAPRCRPSWPTSRRR